MVNDDDYMSGLGRSNKEAQQKVDIAKGSESIIGKADFGSASVFRRREEDRAAQNKLMHEDKRRTRENRIMYRSAVRSGDVRGAAAVHEKGLGFSAARRAGDDMVRAGEKADLMQGGIENLAEARGDLTHDQRALRADLKDLYNIDVDAEGRAGRAAKSITMQMYESDEFAGAKTAAQRRDILSQLHRQGGYKPPGTKFVTDSLDGDKIVYNKDGTPMIDYGQGPAPAKDAGIAGPRGAKGKPADPKAVDRDHEGRDFEGNDEAGFNKKGLHKDTGTKFDADGFDADGFDEEGLDKDGNPKPEDKDEDVDVDMGYGPTGGEGDTGPDAPAGVSGDAGIEEGSSFGIGTALKGINEIAAKIAARKRAPESVVNPATGQEYTGDESSRHMGRREFDEEQAESRKRSNLSAEDKDLMTWDPITGRRILDPEESQRRKDLQESRGEVVNPATGKTISEELAMDEAMGGMEEEQRAVTNAWIAHQEKVQQDNFRAEEERMAADAKARGREEAYQKSLRDRQARADAAWKPFSSGTWSMPKSDPPRRHGVYKEQVRFQLNASQSSGKSLNGTASLSSFLQVKEVAKEATRNGSIGPKYFAQYMKDLEGVYFRYEGLKRFGLIDKDKQGRPAIPAPPSGAQVKENHAALNNWISSVTAYAAKSDAIDTRAAINRGDAKQRELQARVREDIDQAKSDREEMKDPRKRAEVEEYLQRAGFE
jgi:hypothetical protein